jgi:AraC-like DNA-binding protein
VLALTTAARSIGIDIDATTLAPTRRFEGKDALVPASEHLAVARAIFEDPRETLGIELAQALPLATTGLWGFLLRSSATYGDMLRRAQRYIRVANRFSEFHLEERGEGSALVCPHPDPSPYGRREQVVCVFLGHWIAWGRELTGISFPVRRARFRWQGPNDVAPFARFFEGAIDFGAEEDSVILAEDVLALPLPEAAPEMSAELEAYAAALIDRMKEDDPIVDRVRGTLAEALMAGEATEIEVARRLAMTPRTLRRRLSAAQSSFRALREEVLRARALKLLREDRLSIGEVSYLLGYAEPSNFDRAFRRWTGIAPSEWRAGAQPKT